mgnify:CR=1 FL=1
MDSINPNNSEQQGAQNFAPEKKPSVWQRFVLWLKSLSPKKKALFWGAIGIGLIVVGLILYFTLAKPLPPGFEFLPQSGIWNAGGAYQVDVRVRAPFNADVTSFDMSIKYRLVMSNGDELDASLLNSWQITPEIPGEFQDRLTLSQSGNTIKLESSGTGVLIPSGRVMTVLNIKVVVPEDVQGGISFKLDFSGGINTMLVEKGDEVSLLGGESLSLEEAEFAIVSNEDQVYLSPQAASVEQDKVLDIDVRVNAASQDIIAVAAQIEYDPAVLELVEIRESPEFPVIFSQGESHDQSNRTITLVRGTYGDGNNNNGTERPSIDKQGLNGNVALATLRFKGVAITDSTSVEITDAQAIEDDGQGTFVSGFQGYGGTYVVTQAFGAGLQITRGPYVRVYQSAGSNEWKAEITWGTNLASNSEVCYSQTKEDLEDVSSNCTSSSTSSTSPGDCICVSNPRFVKDHSMVLPQQGFPSLSPNQTYYFLVRSQTRGAGGGGPDVKSEPTFPLSLLNFIIKPAQAQGSSQTVESDIFSFVVGKQISTNLEIVNLSADPSYRSAVISWNTRGGEHNGLATTQITRCDCLPSDDFWQNDNNYTLTHSIRVINLEPNTSCTCYVKSVDQSGQEAEGQIPFTTKSDQSPDANIVLKVKRDRICDKWLYCRSSIQVVNNKNRTENLCFDLGVCDEQDEEGNCVKTSSLEDLGISFTEQTYFHPWQVNKIQNLSGLAKVGLDWGEGEVNGQPVRRVIPGYYNYGIMKPTGTDIAIPNSGFESGEEWPWEPRGAADISVINDPQAQDKANKFLRIAASPESNDTWVNAQMLIGQISSDNTYAISLGIRSNSNQTKNVQIQFKVGESNYYTIQTVPVSNCWQTIALTSNQEDSQFASVSPGIGYLNIGIRKSELGSDAIYIDNISMKSVLPVASGINVARSCRLYPSASAPDCDYVDMGGKEYRGWWGFCVEEDQKNLNFKETKLDANQKMCLNWWPIDILPGETDIFGSDQQAGYDGRQPLYYCLEAAGNAIGKDGYIIVKGKISTKDDKSGCDSVRPIGKAIGGCGSGDVIKTFYKNNWDLYECDIDHITFTVRRRSHEDWPKIGEQFTASRENNWQVSWHVRDAFAEASCNSSTGNYFGLRVRFVNGKYESIGYKACDASGEGGVALMTNIYLREPCKVLAQVVTPDGRNTAWASRVQGSEKYSNWKIDNALGYKYSDDYYPYGAAVVGDPVSAPDQWTEPLYVMPADKTNFTQKPYQVRAGSPYAIKANNKCRYTEQECDDNEDCSPVENICRQQGLISLCSITGELCSPNKTCPPVDNVCEPSGNIGSTQCIAGSAENLGKTGCKSNSDCGSNYSSDGSSFGLCMGINLTDDQKLVIGGGWEAGKRRLSQLFAKSYGIWVWQADDEGKMRYVELGDNENWDITGFYADKKPQVINIKVRDQKDGNIVVQSPKALVLKFNAIVDEDHLPMTAYRVDWDDGSALSQVNNLKVYPRTNEDKPYVLFHTYECKENGPGWRADCGGYGLNGSCCVFQPKIQVEDNWGWCNNGKQNPQPDTDDKCPSDRSNWAKFNGAIIVTTSEIKYQCNDGVDNDGDGYCDTATAECTDGTTRGDPGCSSPWDWTENEPPSVSITSPAPGNFTGQEVAFQTEVSDPEDHDLTYTWDFGGSGTKIRGSDSNPVFKYNDYGTYQVTLKVTDKYGASETDSISLTLMPNQPPIIDSFTADPVAGIPGMTVNFALSASDPNNDTLTKTLEFGDGQKSINPPFNVTHTYNTRGQYTARFTVDDGVNPPVSEEVTIYVDWWDANYQRRQDIRIENTVSGAEVLPAQYPVKLVLDTQSLISQGKMRADANDLRIVYTDSSGVPRELDRLVYDVNSNQTQVWFALQEPIPARASNNSDYKVYYSYAGASNPPTDEAQVFAILNDSNTLGVYNFEEDGGDQVLDSSGNNMNGKIYNDATRVIEGRWGKALSFDGMDDYVGIPGGSYWEVSGDFTYEAWIKPDSSSSSDLGMIAANDAWQGFGMRVYYPGSRVGGTIGYPGADWFNASISLNSWNHVAVVYDDSSQEAKVYVNGVLKDTANVNPPQWTGGATGSVTLGAPTWLGEFFRGLIDGVRISNVARTDFSYAKVDYEPPVTASGEISIARALGKSRVAGAQIHKQEPAQKQSWWQRIIGFFKELFGH